MTWICSHQRIDKKQPNRRKNNAKTVGHMCSAKSKRQIIIVYELLFFVAFFLFGTSSAKTVREHDQWSQTQETTPTQETQRKKKNRKPRKAPKRNRLALTL